MGGGGHKVSIYLVDNSVFANFPSSWRFTIPMYYRLLMPAVLYDLAIDRCIYIDVDVLCLNDVSSLFSMDLRGNVVAVVADIGNFWQNDYQEEVLGQFGWKDTSLYFNSGVMLIDIKAWHHHQVEQHFFRVANEYAKNPGKYPDQDILNVILQDKVYFLADKFNWQHWLHVPDSLTHYSHVIVFAHFLGDRKPWLFFGRHPVYEKYFFSSPWGEYLPPDDSQPRRTHRLYAKCLMGVGGDKSLIIKHYLIYLRKRFGLMK